MLISINILLQINHALTGFKGAVDKKVPRNDDVGLQAEPVSNEPVTQAELVSSDAINYDLLAAAILKQSQTISSKQTNSSDDTIEIIQPCVQNRRPRSFNSRTANNNNNG